MKKIDLFNLLQILDTIGRYMVKIRWTWQLERLKFVENLQKSFIDIPYEDIWMSNEGLCTKTGPLNRISYHLTRGPNSYSSKISGKCTRTDRKHHLTVFCIGSNDLVLLVISSIMLATGDKNGSVVTLLFNVSTTFTEVYFYEWILRTLRLVSQKS